MPDLQVDRMGYALGARVTGVDLGASLDEPTVAAIRRAWLQNLVLCIPGQDLDANQLADFAHRFGGELDDNRQTPDKRDPQNIHVVLNTNQAISGKPWSGYRSGQSWHSDRSFTRHPDMATFLLAKAVPEVGGDTIFTNMYLAYETLSPKLRAILDGLQGVHDAAMIKNSDQRGATAADIRRANPPVTHPVVIVHPETGRRALFVGDRVRAFAGMSEEESRPLLEFLVRHAVSYEFTYRHRWSAGDLLIWDNRCTMHIAIGDYDMHAQPRHLLRCTTLGPSIGTPYVEA